VSANELARYCGVDLKTIHNWTDRGKIEGIRTAGRHLRFRRLVVVEFLRAYEFTIPEALRQGSARVAVIDGAASDIVALRRVLGRRFETEAYADVVEGLVHVAAFDADVIVLGDVSPLEVRRVMTALATTAQTRAARIVTLGWLAPGAVASAPRGDPAAICDVLERVTAVG
jgi:excisionase family DNA binding protein